MTEENPREERRPTRKYKEKFSNLLASIVSEFASLRQKIAGAISKSTAAAATIKALVFLSVASLFLKLGEYAVVEILWIALFFVLASQIFHWNLSTESTTLRRFSKMALLILTVVLCGFLFIVTNINRGDQAWSSLYKGPEPFKSDQFEHSMLVKYPLGYVIFDIDHRNQVTSYEQQRLDEYDLDWSVVGITKNTPNEIEIRIPDVSLKNGKKIFTNAVTGGPKQVGNLGGATFNGILMWGEILAIKNDGIVFLVGFERAPNFSVISIGNTETARLLEGKPVEIATTFSNLDLSTINARVAGKVRYILGSKWKTFKSQHTIDSEETTREEELWNEGLLALRSKPLPVTVFPSKQPVVITVNSEHNLSQLDLKELKKNRGDIYVVLSIRYDDEKGAHEVDVCRHASITTSWLNCLRYNGASTEMDW